MSNPSPSEKKWWRPRTIWGLAVTAIWLLVAAAFIHIQVGWWSLLYLDANLMGDFVAGVAAPLAFLWLVLGYFQQGEELRLQRRELSAQREQLELQRRETERLANEAKRQASAVEANEFHARRDTFMRMADLEWIQLNSLAIKIGQYAGGGKDVQIVLREIETGNRYAAFENACHTIVTRSGIEIRNAVNGSAFAQKDVDYFLDAYESLMRQATFSDPENLLRRHFESCAMGSLYAALCIVRGRTIEFCVQAKPVQLSNLQ